MTAAAPPAQRRARLRPGARAASLLQRQGALVALVVACVFGASRYYAFATPENLTNVVRQNSMPGLVALGMTFVILTGGIDLSVGALFAVAGVVTAMLAGQGAAVAALGGIAAATALGLVNGVVIARARIQPFVVTLAMMIAARGAVLGVTGEQSVAIPSTLRALTWIGRGSIGPVPVPVAILALAYLAGWATLRYTRFGRHVYALGDNGEAARLMGLEVDRLQVATYALSGLLAGMAGVIQATRLGAGQPVAGAGLELDAIAAVVIGGTLLTGGQGGVGATLVGVLLLGVIFNLFNLEGTLTSAWQLALRGAILLAVVMVQGRLGRKASAAR